MTAIEDQQETIVRAADFEWKSPAASGYILSLFRGVEAAAPPDSLSPARALARPIPKEMWPRMRLSTGEPFRVRVGSIETRISAEETRAVVLKTLGSDAPLDAVLRSAFFVMMAEEEKLCFSALRSAGTAAAITGLGNSILMASDASRLLEAAVEPLDRRGVRLARLYVNPATWLLVRGGPEPFRDTAFEEGPSARVGFYREAEVHLSFTIPDGVVVAFGARPAEEIEASPEVVDFVFFVEEPISVGIEDRGEGPEIVMRERIGLAFDPRLAQVLVLLGEEDEARIVHPGLRDDEDDNNDDEQGSDEEDDEDDEDFDDDEDDDEDDEFEDEDDEDDEDDEEDDDSDGDVSARLAPAFPEMSSASPPFERESSSVAFAF